MIRVKHLFDPVDPADGVRLWAGPGGLTRALAEWCQVDYLLTGASPPAVLVEFMDEHPIEFPRVTRLYADWLASDPARTTAARQLAADARRWDYTLLHATGDPVRNVAAVLREALLSFGTGPQPDQADDVV